MPLTDKGKSILKDFKKQYGEDKGKNIFYGYMKENPNDTISWHKDKNMKTKKVKLNRNSKKGFGYNRKLKRELKKARKESNRNTRNFFE